MTLDQLLSKAFNGKAENIVISKNIIMFHLDGVETRINLVSFIDQIFNDHDAIVKAKDEEIRRLNNLYADTIKDLGDALLEIERMKEAMQEFVNRCEKGEVRSKYTYSKFKELLKDKK